MGLIPYLFGLFRVYCCQAVRREIITTDPEETELVYPQAAAFLVAEEDGRLHLQEPQHALTRFGAGEAHAIALALENNWVLLINDSRPLTFARTFGVSCVSVPGFCVQLYTLGKITYPAARGYLKRLSSTTSRALISEAEQVLMQAAQLRGEPT
jgi:predicted nucleic acid-binding protein